MIALERQTQTGFLFTWKGGRSPLLTEIPNVSITPLAAGWMRVRLRTQSPFLIEDQPDDGFYYYDYLFRMHGEHVLFASWQHHVVESFLHLTGIGRMMRKPAVDVDRLVKELSQKPHYLYTISRVYANVDAYGRKLRAISLFGDDLVDVPTFQELLPLLETHRVELRNVQKRVSVLCIDAAGGIDFYYKDTSSLKLVLQAVSFLSTGLLPRCAGEKEPPTIAPVKPYIKW